MAASVDFNSSVPQPLDPQLGSLDVKVQSKEEIKQRLSGFSAEAISAWANSKNERGQTQLAIAIEASTPEANKMDVIAFLLLECGANPNLGDNDNWTPLYRASTGTRSEALELLLSQGADPNIANKDGSTPLHRLVDRGSERDVKTLISKNADVNIINCFGSPLAYAAKNGNIAIAEILLDAGADPNLMGDPLDATPVELAINNRKPEMKEFLLSRGAKELLPIESSVHTDISRLVYQGDAALILRSFEQGEKDHYGRSVAHYCAHLGRVDLLEKMCQLGNVDVSDTKGRTPLHYAVIKGQDDVVKFLMSAEGKSNLETPDLQGYIPLTFACQYNREGIFRNILQRGAEQGKVDSLLNHTDKFGWKAIHKAAQVGNKELVRRLVEDYGVDYTQTITNHGRTPMDLAIATKAQDVIEYLQSLMTSLPEGVQKV